MAITVRGHPHPNAPTLQQEASSPQMVLHHPSGEDLHTPILYHPDYSKYFSTYLALHV